MRPQTWIIVGAGRMSVQMFLDRNFYEEKHTIQQTIAGAIDLNRVNLALLAALLLVTYVPAISMTLPNLYR